MKAKVKTFFQKLKELEALEAEQMEETGLSAEELGIIDRSVGKFSNPVEVAEPEPETRFSDIYVGGDWSYRDMLGDKPLEHGERLKVEFPDGTVETHTIEVEDVRDQSYSDHGHNYPMRVTKAYIKLEHGGAIFLCRALNLSAKRVRTPTVSGV